MKQKCRSWIEDKHLYNLLCSIHKLYNLVNWHMSSKHSKQSQQSISHQWPHLPQDHKLWAIVCSFGDRVGILYTWNKENVTFVEIEISNIKIEQSIDGNILWAVVTADNISKLMDCLVLCKWALHGKMKGSSGENTILCYRVSSPIPRLDYK